MFVCADQKTVCNVCNEVMIVNGISPVLITLKIQCSNHGLAIIIASLNKSVTRDCSQPLGLLSVLLNYNTAKDKKVVY